jgi:hypothetical protein
MKPIKFFVLAALLLFFGQESEALSNLPKNDKHQMKKDREWLQLFNGRNLEGWIPKVTGYKSGENPLKGFRVENGILKVDYSNFAAFNGRFGHLFYEEKFSSFVLHVEYRFTGELMPDAPSYCYRNSGVMIFSQSPESMEITQNWPVSIEVQILGSTDKRKQLTACVCTPGTNVFYNGALSKEHCINSTSKYFYDGEWVNLDIIVHGSRDIYHVINGDTVFHFSKPQIGGALLTENYPLPEGTILEDGYIALQAEGQPIDFRNVKLKILDDKEVTRQESKTPAPQAQTHSTGKMIDNFDAYTGSEQLASKWYKPGHGGDLIRMLDAKIIGGGKYSLKCAYTTTKSDDKFYSTLCRVDKWDLSGCTGVRFWFKPDGSGREMTFQLNIANKYGKNIHDLWEYTYLTEKGDTDARWVTLPFFSFKHNIKYADSPDVSPVFKPEAVIEVAIYIGGKNDEPGSGVFYFDEMEGCKLQF